MSAPILTHAPLRALTVLEVAARLRCSRRKVFDLLSAGRLMRARERVGKEILVTVASLDRYEREIFDPLPEPRPHESTVRRRARLRSDLAAIRPKE